MRKSDSLEAPQQSEGNVLGGKLFFVKVQKNKNVVMLRLSEMFQNIGLTLLLLSFLGTLCDINIYECHSNPCLHNATCTDLIGGYTCVCPAGFTGKWLWE